MFVSVEAQSAVAAAVVVRGERVLLVRRRVAEGAAAVRETEEETGLLVVPERVLGQRVHPMTGREIHYIACRPVGGQAVVASADEVAGLAWATHGEIPQYVPHGLFGPVQNYLDGALLS
ncbi:MULTISPECIES: NUDIX domain-containing protein [unclassified Streptomyces]|uniref:NUDIX domain-containing protein n=1 Tax=unclassified Streptomyces TaxID=2593676 RepID=UPI0038309FF3